MYLKIIWNNTKLTVMVETLMAGNHQDTPNFSMYKFLYLLRYVMKSLSQMDSLHIGILNLNLSIKLT